MGVFIRHVYIVLWECYDKMLWFTFRAEQTCKITLKMRVFVKPGLWTGLDWAGEFIITVN